VANRPASRKRRPALHEERRLIHLRAANGLEPKCGARDAASLTNWVRGASYEEIYVPADVLQRADVICGKCQDAALHDDSGSDDEVVADQDAAGAAPDADDAPDTAFVEVTDERLLREIARRFRGESAPAGTAADEDRVLVGVADEQLVREIARRLRDDPADPGAPDPALVGIRDARLLREIARRLGDEETLAQEDGDEADKHGD